MEAAGIEPSAKIVVSADEQRSCQHTRGEGGALVVHDDGSSSHFLSSNDPALHWAVQHWEQLPPLVLDLVHEISVTGTTPTAQPGDQSIAAPGNALGQLASAIAKRCRSIVQGCLREEEWIDADHEFCTVVEEEIRRALGGNNADDLPIEGSIGTQPENSM